MILLNPGPVTLTEREKLAFKRRFMSPRTRVWQITTGHKEKLLKVYNFNNSDWTSILLTGSGTAAVEDSYNFISSNKYQITYC